MTGPRDGREPGEFDLIRRYFAPLAQDVSGAFDLLDDAAVLHPREGCELVLTKDAIVEGVHFLSSDPLDLVAQKLLRVNLSDLAAKGAAPHAYLLGVHWPRDRSTEELGLFGQGLAKDQTIFGISLIGGDTVSTPGPASFSLTALGEVPAGGMVQRCGAMPGDVIYVTGTLGDGANGLRVASGEWPSLSSAHRLFLLNRYQLPQPRVRFGVKARAFMSAALDISDGLLADLGHLCARSGVSARLFRDQLPLSEAVLALLETESAESVWGSVFTGGDDYEILASVRAGDSRAFEALGQEQGVQLTRIGEIVPGDGEILSIGSDGLAFDPPHAGFSHFRTT